MALFGPDPEVAALRARVARLEAALAEVRQQLGMPAAPDIGRTIPAYVRDLAASGKKIAAIKELREQTGMGLAEAKETIERL